MVISEVTPQKYVQNNNNGETEKPASNGGGYELMWRKKSNKVHKTWEGDAFGKLRQLQTHNYLLDVIADGRRLGSVKLDSTALQKGSILSSNGFEFEIGEHVESPTPTPQRAAAAAAEPKVASPNAILSGLNTPFRVNRPLPKRNLESVHVSAVPGNTKLKKNSVASDPFKEPFKPPLKTEKSIPLEVNVSESFKAPLKAPLKAHSQFSAPFSAPFKPQLNRARILKTQGSSGISPTTTTTTTKEPLKIEPYIDENLLHALRPHQIEGVEFIVNSVLGLRHGHGEGCILADEMGLGKTLTSIAAVHTLIRHKFLKCVLIVCPVTLISNWKAEFAKWLPPAKYPQFGVLAVDQSGLGNNSIRDPATKFFSDSKFKSYQVMVLGYERVRLVLPQLAALSREFDMVICDEGHRLKTSNSKTAEAIEQISSSRRVILTGTPIQNDLSEFWALANFVNPNVFGSESQFNRRYLHGGGGGGGGGSGGGSGGVKQGEGKLGELIEACDEFMLRRDAATLSKYLSVPKSEMVVFCRPTKKQMAKYQQLTGTALEGLLGGTSAVDQGACLQAISELRKAAAGDREDTGGKVKFLSNFLDALRELSPQEKVVIVSGSTRVLDLCQDVCVSKNIRWLRLDGSTPQDKRQSSVNLFNRQPVQSAGAFLLSSRSGGMGLNLVGASRLVLMDCDWNPAIDAQVMGRIHRDGQTRPCHIYRLLTTGTIDEKIFQRQMSKVNLSQHVLLSANNHKVPEFDREALRDIFSFSVPEKCNTIDATSEFVGYVEVEVEERALDAVLEKAARAADVSCVLTRV